LYYEDRKFTILTTTPTSSKIHKLAVPYQVFMILLSVQVYSCYHKVQIPRVLNFPYGKHSTTLVSTRTSTSVSENIHHV